MPDRIGPYELRGELGRGGMGVVYRAWDPHAEREVALKLLLVGRGADARRRARFVREGEAVARVEHPHVVRVHAAGEAGGYPYLVMELLQGETLQDRLDREGPLPPREAAALVARLAGAVQACHERGVLHRDLKPDNVFLRRVGGPVLTDFGLARDLDERATRLSATGQWLGTPGYWAPEQATGQTAAVGPATDVYGLGATLYAALAGGPPFEAADMLQAVGHAVQGRPQPPSRRRAGVDPGLDAICLRCLEKEPARRYPAAAALERDLEAHLAGERVGAPRAGRGRWRVAAIAGALLAGGAAAGWAVRGGRAAGEVDTGGRASAASSGAEQAVPGAGAGPSAPGAPRPPAAARGLRWEVREGDLHRYVVDWERRIDGELESWMRVAMSLRAVEVDGGRAELTAEILRFQLEIPRFMVPPYDSASPEPSFFTDLLGGAVGAPFTVDLDLTTGQIGVRGYPELAPPGRPVGFGPLEMHAGDLLSVASATSVRRQLENHFRILPGGEAAGSSWTVTQPLWSDVQTAHRIARPFRREAERIRAFAREGGVEVAHVARPGHGLLDASDVQLALSGPNPETGEPLLCTIRSRLTRVEEPSDGR